MSSARFPDDRLKVATGKKFVVNACFPDDWLRVATGNSLRVVPVLPTTG